MLYSNILGESGKPLLILHGFLGMSDNWKTLGRKYARQGFQAHLIDQRNHGRSFHSDEFNYEVLAEDIKKYCEYHKLNAISLIGHSMGGKTAMNVAVKYPELIDKLIIADIGTKFYPSHHEQILAGLEAVESATLTKRVDADTILEKFVFEMGTRQFLLKNLYWQEDKTLGLRLNLAVLQANVEEIGEPLSAMAIYSKETLFLKRR